MNASIRTKVPYSRCRGRSWTSSVVSCQDRDEAGMKSSPKKSWLTSTAVRKRFPEVDLHTMNALIEVWDEVVHQIIEEMLTLSETNDVELHINVREDMVMELARLQHWLAEQVVEKRVKGRELSSIDIKQEREECLGSQGVATILGTARIVHEQIWSKRLTERWKPKSVKAIEREAKPKKTALSVKPVGKNHFIPRWFIRDHWATDGKVLRWRRSPDGWRATRRGFGEWGYRRKLYSDPLEAYFGLLEGDAKRPIEMLLEMIPLNAPQREALVGFLVIQILRNPYTISALHESLVPVIDELGYGDDPEMPRKAYESLYRNNEFYHRIASPVMWSSWAMVRSERPVFVLPDTFCARVGAMDGIRLIVPLTPTFCFVTLPSLEQEKRIVPFRIRSDEQLGRRIALVLAQAAAEEFLSDWEFGPVEGEAESPDELLMDIARVVAATAEDGEVSWPLTPQRR